MTGSWRTSLRLRLLAGMLVWVCCTLAATGIVLAELFRDHVGSQFRAELRRDLDQLTSGFDLGDNELPQLKSPEGDPRWRQPYSGLYWQINGPGRPAYLRSRSLWDSRLEVPSDQLADGDVHEHLLIGPAGRSVLLLERQVWSDSDPAQHWQLVVAADTSPLEEAVGRFVRVLVLSLCVLATGLMLAVFLQIRIGLGPLTHLQHAVNRVRSGEERRLGGRFPRELQPLVDDFNRVLDRNDEMVERSRIQAGNLAHALKTPMAVLANAALSEHSELSALVIEQTESARRHIDWHLAQARAAASASAPAMRTPVLPVLQSLIRVMERVHADKQLQFELEGEARLVFAGEEPHLLEMLGNLMDNACKWARSKVVISVDLRGRQLQVRVEDDGPGLPPEARDLVLHRGVRLDERTPGSGLGLSIVDDMSRLYGGSVVLEASPLGGLRAQLMLPGSMTDGAAHPTKKP